jgi:DNA-binding NarL/FixJ family response regulator
MSPLATAKNSTDAATNDPENNGKPSILIVDDHPIVRFGLNALLSTQRDFEIAGLAESGEAALKILQKSSVDIVLLDLRMPGLSGTDTLKRVAESTHKVRTIVISSFEYDEEIYAAVKAGAQGFVHKEADAQEILRAIRAVGRGMQFFPKHISDRMTNDQMTAGLSVRETEVLQLVATGLTNKEVARTLSISQFTVRNHLNHITQKLDATDRTEAIFIALQTGLISPP